MNFYKIIPIIAIIVLIVCLSAVGVALNYTSQDVIFPPNISDCPDFFVKKDNKCVNVKNLGKDDPQVCSNVDFNLGDTYKNPGMGESSGICAKKKWANDCKVNWDGVTNNRMVCHSK
mgnify:CR=1 FL=1